jgi:hypothetical protein
MRSMKYSIVEQVVEFYATLFDSVFSERFRPEIPSPLKRRDVLRRVDEAADAASQSLTRLFLNEKLTEKQTQEILNGLSSLRAKVRIEHISNANVSPDSLVNELLTTAPIPSAVKAAGQDSLYRVSMHTIIQVLMLVGPVMAEWQKLKFSSTFELPRRVVNRLNQISERFTASGSSEADRSYEETYRDHLLSRFHQVGVGTVRITTQMDVDLRELFVMPRILTQAIPAGASKDQGKEGPSFLDLKQARAFLQDDSSDRSAAVIGEPVLEQVKRYPRNVLIGPPGSGKSTFLEWLQLQLAFVEVELIMSGEQAIPLLLRVRELDPLNLPTGSELLVKAMASHDRAALAPPNWLNRQLTAGRVLVMLDGLDETEPELRDRRLLPWFLDLCRSYPGCRYLVSSRPVGYPPNTLKPLEFAECSLLDFSKEQVGEYAKHWCTAVRLARNESEDEARAYGMEDGEKIVGSFEGNAYIRNLARNPLMLSAICLVNYFEGGKLPDDRAVLYRMCVEGLLHHWDHRRGIRSQFSLEEKLAVSRELALDMQAVDLAECEVKRVKEVFSKTLGDSHRAQQLLEHIRYRTGLLFERRNGVFAFAHLTFQEYLAAEAISRGNLLGIDSERIVREHDDGRWNEVVALYCGTAGGKDVTSMLRLLIGQSNSASLGTVLGEAYFSSSSAIQRDGALRLQTAMRIARAPHSGQLARFPETEASPIANSCVAPEGSELLLSEAFDWLRDHGHLLDEPQMLQRLQEFKVMGAVRFSEVMYLLHRFGSAKALSRVAGSFELYDSAGPQIGLNDYGKQGVIALLGLAVRKERNSRAADAALLQALTAAALVLPNRRIETEAAFEEIFLGKKIPADKTTWPKFLKVGRVLVKALRRPGTRDPAGSLSAWLSKIEEARTRGPRARPHVKSRRQPERRTR